MAPPQPDSLLYEQYARAFAEGHPYRFMEDDRPSTGSTSHLYPAVLALFYLLGGRGDALTTAAFLLNLACYLTFLWLFWQIAKSFLSKNAPTAMVLCVVSGHTAFSFFSQSDMGLFTLLSFAAFFTALKNRPMPCAILLVLASWTRPEGAILSVVMIAVFGAGLPRWPGKNLPFVLAGAAGLAGWGAVLLLNKMLTGTTTFFSVLGKSEHVSLGYTVMEGTATLAALARTVLIDRDGGDLSYYLLPVAGGLFLITGVAMRRWKATNTATVEVWWLVSILASLAVISTSGWQGVQHDRYLTWMLPMGFIYLVLGAEGITAYKKAPAFLRPLVAGLLAIQVIYQGLGLAYFVRIYDEECRQLKSHIAFAQQLNETVEEGTRFGMDGLTGLAYYMPRHHITNLNGITSPAFAKDFFITGSAEILKHRPETRFNAWIVPTKRARTQWFAPFLGEQLAEAEAAVSDQDVLGLYAAQWGFLDYANGPFTRLAQDAVEEMDMVDSLDVGYPEDEDRHVYEIADAGDGLRFFPFVKTASINARPLSEVGRAVKGWERFTIRCRPGKAVRIVLRTTLHDKAYARRPYEKLQWQEIVLDSPVHLSLTVNGAPVREFVLAAQNDADDFQEWVLDIPQAHVQGESITVEIGGDHFSFAYWFYQ